MKTEHSLTELNFPQLSEQEEAQLTGGGGLPPIQEEEPPL